MAAAFTMLFAKISAVISWFSSLFISIFVAAWSMGKDLLSWGFDQILKVIISIISSIDVSGLQSLANSAGGVPASIVNILSILGVGTAISIISAALLIRLGLQLIPFVRLGS